MANATVHYFIQLMFYLLCSSLGASHSGYDGIPHWFYGAHSLPTERGTHQIIEVISIINVVKIYERALAGVSQ